MQWLEQGNQRFTYPRNDISLSFLFPLGHLAVNLVTNLLLDFAGIS